MNRLFRTSTPGLAEYLSLAVVLAAFLGLAALLVAPGGSFTSTLPGQITLIVAR